MSQPAPEGGRFVRGGRYSAAAARGVVRGGGDVTHLEAPCAGLVRRGGISTVGHGETSSLLISSMGRPSMPPGAGTPINSKTVGATSRMPAPSTLWAYRRAGS